MITAVANFFGVDPELFANDSIPRAYVKQCIRDSTVKPRKRPSDVLTLLVDAMKELESSGKNVFGSRAVRRMINKIRPGLNLNVYGVKSFKELLRKAQKCGLIKIERGPATININIRREPTARLVKTRNRL